MQSTLRDDHLKEKVNLNGQLYLLLVEISEATIRSDQKIFIVDAIYTRDDYLKQVDPNVCLTYFWTKLNLHAIRLEFFG